MGGGDGRGEERRGEEEEKKRSVEEKVSGPERVEVRDEGGEGRVRRHQQREVEQGRKGEVNELEKIYWGIKRET